MYTCTNWLSNMNVTERLKCKVEKGEGKFRSGPLSVVMCILLIL